MALPAENISLNIFKTTAANISTGQLQQLVAEEPYFGAAWFLYAKKMYELKQEGYEQALQKAALHFCSDLFLHHNLIADEELLPEIKPASVIQEEQENFSAEAPALTVLAENPPEDEIPISEIVEDVIINDKLTTLLQEQAAEFDKPVETSTELTIENTPYHRIDYFASQGINLDEENAGDKLSSQLKRFTDWLKQMKRINPNPSQLQTDEAGEQQVQSIALHSNEGKEIVTETMAEVLIRQGKPEQAIHIYEKLSFNNPSKSAYFAAKIEELKS